MNKTDANVNLDDAKTPCTMKCLPASERPYEKCMEKGAESLSDAELLAVILRSGSSGETALDLSRKILSLNGENSGLLGLYHMSIPDLTKIKGLGKVKAAELKCIVELSKRISRCRFSEGVCFTNPEAVAEYYMEDMRHLEQEIVILVMLNSKGRLIHDTVLSKGTVRASMISPREIFIEALRYQAVSIILLHNHPSGIPDPSPDDIRLTERIRRSGDLIGIELLDHIIIGDCQAVSMREQQFWQKNIDSV